MRRELALRDEGASLNHNVDRELDRLFFNFLRISPSYGLACRSPRLRITRSTPQRSKDVIQTYRTNGDVYSVKYEKWSESRAGKSGKTTPQQQTLLMSQSEDIRCAEGYLALLIPLDLTQEEATRQFQTIVTPHLKPQVKDRERHIRNSTLWKALATVYQRAKYPDVELWRVGVLANIVERYRGQLDAWEPRKLARQAEMRRHLTLMTVRALVLALLVAENAAIGHFPVKAPIKGEQLEFPFSENRLYELLTESGDEEFELISGKTLLLR